MYRVLLALLAAAIALQLSGCTGTLRLGSSIPEIPVVEIAHFSPNA